MRITRTLGAIIATSALLLGACGTDEDVDTREPAEESSPTADEGQDDPDADENAGDEAPGDDADDQEDPEASDPGNTDFANSLACDTAYDGPETDLDTYQDAYLEANYELEQLVMELGQKYSEFESGAQTSDEFVANLEELANSYGEITAEPIETGPPEQAAQWHANTVESWGRICLALVDAHDGVVNGDDTQLALFEEALTENPTLLNDLHANTMMGPGENV